MKTTTQKIYFGEKWKNVIFPFDFTNNYSLEVSNFGRIRSFNKISNGNILAGSITEGYKIIRLKFFKEIDETALKSITALTKKIAVMTKKVKLLQENGEAPIVVKEAMAELKKIKTTYSKKLAQNTKDRTIHYHSLIHRLVAMYFLPKPSSKKTIVAHLDFDKLNNSMQNLVWMTPEENYAHQAKSPYVLAEKNRRFVEGPGLSKNFKLTVTKVMLLKKLLNEGRKTVKQLSKQFKVSDMQIIRIRRGENWISVPAAS